MALRIVTDSTSDLSPALLAKYGISMVPLTVHFGPESFLEGVQLSTDDFWTKVQSSPFHPKTAQPAPGDFLQVFQRLHAEGHEILCVCISANLSGTMNSAQIAAQMLPEAKITVVDTRSVTLGLGMMVIEAARLAEAGTPTADVVKRIDEIAGRMNILFTLDSLEFLQKNGRVGKAASLLGGLLGLKLILQVDREGVVAPADKVRGRSKVLPRALEMLQERVPAGRKVRMAILHANVPEQAQLWVDEVSKVWDVQEYWVGPIGAVVGTNAGPGTVGVVLYEI